MTYKEKIKQMLSEQGMFDEDAEAVVEMVIKDDCNVAMKNRWNDDISNYPSTTRSVLWDSVCRIALEYIDKNCPKAWFRSAFER